MSLNDTVDHLVEKGVLAGPPESVERLSGGTASDVYLLHFKGSRIIIKFNTQTVIEKEQCYMELYSGLDILPELEYSDSAHGYIVYSYIKSSRIPEAVSKEQVLLEVVRKLLNHSREPESAAGFGWVGEPAESWSDFQLSETGFSKEYIGSRLSEDDHDFIEKIAGSLDMGNEVRLLHGDCGFHNFIFKNGRLTGIIDPTPVYGHPVYDLVYAFCSSPDDLSPDTIEFAASQLDGAGAVDKRMLYAQVLVTLYIRLETSLIHQPEAFDEYMEAWHEWKRRVSINS